MAVALDALGEASESGGDPSWTHTPVGTTRGVIVVAASRGVSTDVVAGVDYGGVAMARVTNGWAVDNASELLSIYVYFLGASIPTGAQTVTVDTTGGTAAKCYSVSLTAGADTEVEASDKLEGDQTNPSIVLTTGVGVNTYVLGAVYSGVNSAASITAGSGYTILDSADTGNQVSAIESRDSNATGGSVTVDFAIGSEDCAMVAVAIKESGGGGAATFRSRIAGGFILN